MSAPSGPRLVYVLTHPMTARHLLRGQLAFMRRRGFRVTVVCSGGADLDAVRRSERVETLALAMRREIAPLSDLTALVRLYSLLRRLRPEVVNAGTPKAGLLGMLAARWARVPVRVYTLRGLRLETTRGLKRRLLLFCERLAAGSAHRVVAVSHSLRRRCLELGLAAADRVTVLGAGSSNGVDLDRFAAPGPDPGRIETARGILGLERGTPVVGFVGRLTRDKGIAELLAALEQVARELPSVRLLALGEPEAGDPLPAEVARRLSDKTRVVRAGFVEDTSQYYPLMDVLALPSHREGFPNAPLEAAAAGLPTVGFAVTGTVDAVADGETGTLVRPGDAGALADALLAYLRDPDLRRRHGAAARRRAERDFANHAVWRAWAGEYERLLRGGAAED